MIEETIERFLMHDPVWGFPTNTLKIYCDFEVGGAYETWGWVLEYKGKPYDSCRSYELEKMLKRSRIKLREETKEN